MRRLAERHPVALFLALTFVPSWALWTASGVLWRLGEYPADASWLAAQVGVFCPGLAAMVVASLARPLVRAAAARTLLLLYVPAVALGALIVSRGFADLRHVDAPWTLGTLALAAVTLLVLGRRSSRLVPWPVPEGEAPRVAGWTTGALLVPLAVLAAGWALAAGEGPPRTPIPSAPFRELTAAAAVAALGFNLVFGGSLGEEPGWRGFLLPTLLRDRSPLAASLVVSFWWALWHAPIDWVQGFVATGPGGLLARQVWTLPFTVLFTWVTVRAGGSLLPALALHTGINVFPDFALASPARFESALVVFFVCSVITAVAVCVADPRMLRQPDPGAARGRGSAAGLRDPA